MEATKLRRGPFGYTPRSVHLVLADRDGLLAQASQRAEEAEAQVLDVRSEAEALKTQLAEQAEQLRTLAAAAAELRTDRDAAHRELEGAVGDAARLQLELTATRRQLETLQNDQEAIQLGSEAARGGPDVQDEPLPGAEAPSSEMAFIREELGSARRHFLIQGRQITSAEARIEVLETEVRSLRPELEAGLSAAVAGLEAAHAAVDEVAARAAVDPSVSAEGSSAVPEAAGWTTTRMNGAGAHAAEELREAERARRETLVEIERLTAARDRLASLVGEVRSTVRDAGERAAGVGDRVDEAVAPLTDAIDGLNVRLAAFAELAAPPGEDTLPAYERSLNLVELEEQDGAADRPDPAGVGARTSPEPHTEEAPGPDAEVIVPPAPPPADHAHSLGAERHSG
jgi:outer membrane murein-binding lipoprotein Lpp